MCSVEGPTLLRLRIACACASVQPVGLLARKLRQLNVVWLQRQNHILGKNESGDGEVFGDVLVLCMYAWTHVCTYQRVCMHACAFMYACTHVYACTHGRECCLLVLLQ